MAVKDFPANIVADAEEWTLTYNTQTFESDLNGAMQTAELPGARWSVSMTFSNRQGKSARALQGFLAGLKGRAGRFWVTPTDWKPLGNQADSLGVGPAASLSLDFANDTYFVADGTDEYSGTSFLTHGGTLNDPESLCAGDYVEINGELKKLTADFSTDEAGEGLLEFAPPMRTPVSYEQEIRVDKPRAVMQLSDDGQAGWSASAPVIYSLTINGREALDI